MTAVAQDGFKGTANTDLDFTTSGRQMTNYASPYANNGGEWAHLFGSGSILLVGSSTDGYVYNPFTLPFDFDIYAASSTTPTGFDYWAQADVKIVNGTDLSRIQFGGPAVGLHGSAQWGFAWGYNCGYGQWELIFIAGPPFAPSTRGVVIYAYPQTYATGSPTLVTAKIQATGTNPVQLQLSLNGTLVATVRLNYDLNPGQPGICLSGRGNPSTDGIQLGNFSSGEPVSQAAISVKVVPALATLYTGAKQPFSAIVSNATNPAVTWSVQGGGAGGTINANGQYTAPTTSGTDVIVATSVEDGTKTGTAAVTILQCNPYTLDGTLITDCCTPSQQMQLDTHMSAGILGDNKGELWYLDIPR